jgi:hypothetical protein
MCMLRSKKSHLVIKPGPEEKLPVEIRLSHTIENGITSFVIQDREESETGNVIPVCLRQRGDSRYRCQEEYNNRLVHEVNKQ